MDYQAKLFVPFGVLGIRCSEDMLTGIDFLPASEKPQRATSALAETVCEQLLRYLKNPDAKFSVPFDLHGTPHQQKVWQAMLNIPRGRRAEILPPSRRPGLRCKPDPRHRSLPSRGGQGRTGRLCTPHKRRSSGYQALAAGA